MAKETETITGTCATHGTVEATRDLPRITFPPIYTAIKRSLAKRHPFRCPECGEPVEA
jgi:hypothetical protein